MSEPSTSRPRPEDFLELVQRTKRGRLKVYLGFAAGVGKTCQMLEEAQQLRKRGVDVVLGFIETHGRVETMRLLEGLEQVPRRIYEYRGVSIEELDLDAILLRRPQVAIIDEVAHTNVPLAKHRKRYQDILELLSAGIHVICAFNIQHLERLHELLERVIGITVRERVPDAFLHQADQVVNLDLTVEDLMERLSAGKIYPPEKIEQALAHFFQAGKLTSLRELALREVAESIERLSSRPGQLPAQVPKSSTYARVMVCLSSHSPIGKLLLHRGSRMAGKLNTDWFVVYVELPEEDLRRIDAEAQRILLQHIELARELGAEVVRLQARDAVSALMDFAHAHGVGHIILGRSQRSWWRQRLGLTFVHRMLQEAHGMDLHIVSEDAKGTP